MTDIKTLPEDILIDGDYETREIHVNGKHLRPQRSQAVRNHSPDGFNWGYGGSGPAQLSLALLLHFGDEEFAIKYYKQFKFSVIAKLPESDFETRMNLREEIKKIAE